MRFPATARWDGGKSRRGPSPLGSRRRADGRDRGRFEKPVHRSPPPQRVSGRRPRRGLDPASLFGSGTQCRGDSGCPRGRLPPALGPRHPSRCDTRRLEHQDACQVSGRDEAGPPCARSDRWKLLFLSALGVSHRDSRWGWPAPLQAAGRLCQDTTCIGTLCVMAQDCGRSRAGACGVRPRSGAPRASGRGSGG